MGLRQLDVSTAWARESERVATVAGCGFTLRQARFLVLVLEHAGVCLNDGFRPAARGLRPHLDPCRPLADIAS